MTLCPVKSLLVMVMLMALSKGAVGRALARNESLNDGRTSRIDTDERSNSLEIPSTSIMGMSFAYESDKKRIHYDDFGSPQILEGMAVKIRLFGKLEENMQFKLSKFYKCDDPGNKEEPVQVDIEAGGKVGVVHVKMPRLDGELDSVYTCFRSSSSSGFVRVGDADTPWLTIKLYRSIMPLWLHLTALVILLILSGLFSGLNLGLMSLNKTDLKILMNTGTQDERDYAASISPVRNHGNFLLCCLLFSNVLVNASLTILVDDLTSGLIAVIFSTLAIVIFGEIIPQAICSRHGLAVGAKTIYITKFFMFLTSPLAFPLSKILDCVLGEEIGSVYTRERLKELLRVTKDHHGLETEEVGIISGALEMKTKTVKDIMINLDNVFMLPIDALLDFDTVAYIEYQGYSRIPVYEHSRNNIVGILNVKQLTLLDANDNIPLKTVIQYYQNQLFFVFENTRLDYMFRKFREGSMGHMAFVQRINDEGPGDPYYQTIGLVTFEDVLEELLQAEIMDESDIGKQEARLTNNREYRKPLDFQTYNRKKNKPAVEIPQPLALAAVQFLSTSIEPFTKEVISDDILQRLVRSCAEYVKVPKDKGNQHLPELFLYEAGKPCDHFVLILEGRVEVTVGKEKMIYEAGSFNTFGKDFFQAQLEKEKQAVSSPSEEQPRRKSFVPDYTVKVIADIHYLKIKFSAWKAAILATEIQRKNAGPNQLQNRNWEEEIDHVLEQGAAGVELTTPDLRMNPDKDDKANRKISVQEQQDEVKNMNHSNHCENIINPPLVLELEEKEALQSDIALVTENTKLL